MPVFNSQVHFLDEEGPVRVMRRLRPEEVLTQRGRADPNYNSEIPQGSLVAVHSTVSVYMNTRLKVNFMSFNLLAAQILAIPNGA